MFEELEVIGTTGFLRRTKAPSFTSDGDDWWLQEYNARRYPNRHAGWALSTKMSIKRAVPARAWNAARSVRSRVGSRGGGVADPD
jgi:hypothetical protein